MYIKLNKYVQLMPTSLYVEHSSIYTPLWECIVSLLLIAMCQDHPLLLFVFGEEKTNSSFIN